MHRLDRPRVAPTDERERDDDTRQLLETVGPLNLFTTLAHHPKLLKRWMVFGAHVLAKSTLPVRERELLILRTGWRCGSEYEFGQHTLIARGIGITDDEIVRTTTDDTAGWSAFDAVLMVAADELVADKMLGDATWAALTERWDVQQVMDLIFTVGQYTMVCMALNSLGVERDEGVPGFPGTAQPGVGG